MEEELIVQAKGSWVIGKTIIVGSSIKIGAKTLTVTMITTAHIVACGIMGSTTAGNTWAKRTTMRTTTTVTQKVAMQGTQIKLQHRPFKSD